MATPSVRDPVPMDGHVVKGETGGRGRPVRPVVGPARGHHSYRSTPTGAEARGVTGAFAAAFFAGARFATVFFAGARFAAVFFAAVFFAGARFAAVFFAVVSSPVPASPRSSSPRSSWLAPGGRPSGWRPARPARLARSAH